MKYRSVLLKSLVLVLVFAVLLSVGISLLSYSNIETRNSDDFSTPEINTNTVNAPLSQRQLQKKYNKYNTVTEENGKSVVTIFSEEQIADFNVRRNNGEWFWLSSEEMLFLINNTVELFKTYDIVYIRDLDGNLNKYYGLSFFSSEEYYASFNGFDLGVTDASFDLQKDIYDTILFRVKVFCSFVATKDEWTFCITDISIKPSEKEMTILYGHVNPGFYNGSIDGISSAVFYAWTFNKERIFSQKCNSYIESFYLPDTSTTVYPISLIPTGFNVKKYDNLEKTLIIELYEENSQELIARLRFDEKNDKHIIADCEQLLKDFKTKMNGSNNAQQRTNYRTMVYFNGFEFWDNKENVAIVYCPDGNINLSRFEDSSDIQFTNNYYWQIGFEATAEYLNTIIHEQLNN